MVTVAEKVLKSSIVMKQIVCMKVTQNRIVLSHSRKQTPKEILQKMSIPPMCVTWQSSRKSSTGQPRVSRNRRVEVTTMASNLYTKTKPSATCSQPMSYLKTMITKQLEKQRRRATFMAKLSRMLLRQDWMLKSSKLKHRRISKIGIPELPRNGARGKLMSTIKQQVL